MSTSEALTCPECGKTFTRPASLGAHRNRAHGVTGGSARRRRATRRSRQSATASSRGAAQATRQQTTRARGRVGSSNGSRGGVDRDALLRTVFPGGIPAREDVIRRANAWLDEADQLASTK